MTPLPSLPASPQPDPHPLSQPADSADATDFAWHLVEIPVGGWPRVHRFANRDELTAKLKLQEGQEVMSFIFWGQRAYLSANTPRYLILPDMQTVPLFDLPTTIEPGEYGFQGQAETALWAEPAGDEPVEGSSPEAGEAAEDLAWGSEPLPDSPDEDEDSE